MKKNRLTVEEVNEFKPSFYNPLVVKCDTGECRYHQDEITIITPIIDDMFIIIDEVSDLVRLYKGSLEFYPSQKQPKEITLYRRTYEGVQGVVYQTHWNDTECESNGCKLLKTETKTIIIEEE